MDALVTNFPEILFYVLAAAAVAGGVGVVAFRNPVHSALSLLWTFLVVAALFLAVHFWRIRKDGGISGPL